MSFGAEIEKYLGKVKQNTLIALEYISGDCSKRATGILGAITPNSIQLVSNATLPYVRITFTRDRQPVEIFTKGIIIAVNNLTAVEIDPQIGDTGRLNSEVKVNKDTIHTLGVTPKHQNLMKEDFGEGQKENDIKEKNYSEMDIEDLNRRSAVNEQYELIVKKFLENPYELYTEEDEGYIEELEEPWNAEE